MAEERGKEASDITSQGKALANSGSYSSCGSEVPMDSRFCNSCGAPISGDSQSIGTAATDPGWEKPSS